MPPLIRHRLPVCSSCYRAFTTTSTFRLPLEKSESATLPTEIPPYPYGPAQWYKQSDSGLYGGQRIRFGNNVGTKSGTKTRRSWAINVFRKRLFSKALNTTIQLRVSKTVLRTIDKVGGLDNYLMGETEGRIKGLGMRGWQLRWAIMQTPAMKNKFRKGRRALGLEELEEDVERLNAEKKAALELDEMVATTHPVELDVDEAGEGDPDNVETPAEVQLAEAAVGDGKHAVEEADWQDVEDSTPSATAEDMQLEATAPPQYLRIPVASRRYRILTPHGWRASLPPTKQSNAPDKDKMIQTEVSRNLKAVKAVLDMHNAALQAKGETPMSAEERRSVVRLATRRYARELTESAELENTFRERHEKFHRDTERKKTIVARSRAHKSAKRREKAAKLGAVRRLRNTLS